MRDNDTKLGRRRTLQIIGMGSLTATGLLTLAGCGKSEGGGGAAPQEAAGTGCNSPIDQQAQTLRTSLQYKDQSEKPDQKCSTCAQYIEAKYGDCGGCKLFGGPVQPNGNCLSWAPKEAAAAAG